MSKTFEVKHSGAFTVYGDDSFYVVTAHDHTREEAIVALIEYLGEDIDPESVYEGCMRWHGGIDSEGEMRNCWWLESKENLSKRGANKVWYCGDYEL